MSKQEHQAHAAHQHDPLPCDGAGHEHHHHEDGSCCCHHHEVEYHGMSRVMIVRLAVAVVLMLCGALLPVGEEGEAALMLAVAVIAGYDVVIQALKNLFTGHFFDEYFLMTFAAVAACVIGEYEEGAAVMLLYRIGEACQEYAIRRSRRTLFTLTGETSGGFSGKTERFIRRFSRIYTPAILLIAVLVAVLLPLLEKSVSYSDAVYRALSFLVLACPCAIVISVPLAYSAGIGAASRQSIFFSDSAAVDALAKDPSAPEHFQETELRGNPCAVYGGDPEHPELIVRLDGQGSVDKARRIARTTRRIAYENIFFVIAVKALVLILSAVGISQLWLAVFADSGVTVITVLNSLRAFRAK